MGSRDRNMMSPRGADDHATLERATARTWAASKRRRSNEGLQPPCHPSLGALLRRRRPPARSGAARDPRERDTRCPGGATDVTCQVIDRASLKPLFEARPAMAEEISHPLAQRQGELDGERDALSLRLADGTAHSKKPLGASLLEAVEVRRGDAELGFRVGPPDVGAARHTDGCFYV